MKDDLILSNLLKDYDINEQIIFDGVLLIGTRDFTLLGRPFVGSARVFATVEEQSELEKCIVFKKKRRKTYQKTIQFAHKITVLRINQIELNMNSNLIEKTINILVSNGIANPG